MIQNKLTIKINRPKSSVFDFTIEPDSTPLWIDFVASEKVDTRPIKLGTIYKNTGKDGKENTYFVSQFVEGEVFELQSMPAGYTVRYTYTGISETETELEYFEWVDEGELETPFTQNHLEKLKSIMETE